MKTFELVGKMTRMEQHHLETRTIEAAQAIAKYWDTLREIEVAHGVEFDGTVAALETIAAHYADFTNFRVWDCLENLKITEA